MAGHLIYHWKHGWIPLTHAAALSKAHGSHTGASKVAKQYGIAGDRHAAGRFKVEKSKHLSEGAANSHHVVDTHAGKVARDNKGQLAYFSSSTKAHEFANELNAAHQQGLAPTPAQMDAAGKRHIEETVDKPRAEAAKRSLENAAKIMPAGPAHAAANHNGGGFGLVANRALAANRADMGRMDYQSHSRVGGLVGSAEQAYGRRDYAAAEQHIAEARGLLQEHGGSNSADQHLATLQTAAFGRQNVAKPEKPKGDNGMAKLRQLEAENAQARATHQARVDAEHRATEARTQAEAAQRHAAFQQSPEGQRMAAAFSAQGARTPDQQAALSSAAKKGDAALLTVTSHDSVLNGQGGMQSQTSVTHRFAHVERVDKNGRVTHVRDFGSHIVQPIEAFRDRRSGQNAQVRVIGQNQVNIPSLSAAVDSREHRNFFHGEAGFAEARDLAKAHRGSTPQRIVDVPAGLHVERRSGNGVQSAGWHVVHSQSGKTMGFRTDTKAEAEDAAGHLGRTGVNFDQPVEGVGADLKTHQAAVSDVVHKAQVKHGLEPLRAKAENKPAPGNRVGGPEDGVTSLGQANALYRAQGLPERGASESRASHQRRVAQVTDQRGRQAAADFSARQSARDKAMLADLADAHRKMAAETSPTLAEANLRQYTDRELRNWLNNASLRPKAEQELARRKALRAAKKRAAAPRG